ncbi:MAG: hypothetical protein R2716_05950 [Microthrixaceae bacterium]
MAGGLLFTTGSWSAAPRSEHPLVDMRILANPVFAIGMVSLRLLAVASLRLVYIPSGSWARSGGSRSSRSAC